MTLPNRCRKEQEYQQQLRDQIEEKKRKKEQEKRGEDKVKQRELQEYLRGQFKGDIPQHARTSILDDDDNSDGDRDYGRHRNRDRDRERSHSPRETRSSKGTLPQQSRSNRSDSNSNRFVSDNGSVKDRNADTRSGKQDRRDRGDDDDNNSRKWDDRKSSKSSPKGRQMEGRREDCNADSDTDRGSNEYSKESGHSKGNERRGGSHKHQDKEGRWVTDAEYVELTTLCDRLMSQQDRLQEEIQHQAELIKVSDYSKLRITHLTSCLCYYMFYFTPSLTLMCDHVVFICRICNVSLVHQLFVLKGVRRAQHHLKDRG